MSQVETSVPVVANVDYLHPDKQCDIVMKGGVTSGVVYPPALCVLATQYRFRNIGGTSAGAIAAAGAAAAEYGRESGGFAKLLEVSHWIGRDTNLRDLFQASERTQPLLDVALDTIEEKRKPGFGPRRVLGIIWRRVPVSTDALLTSAAAGAGIGALFGALLTGLVLLAYWLFGDSNWRDVFVPAFTGLVVGLGLIGAVLGWLAGGLVQKLFTLLRIVRHEVPENHLGVCRGRADKPGGPDVLTDWLSATINDLAGRTVDGPPLTFGDLAKKRDEHGKDASITLRMFTTNLSQGQPYILPFDKPQFIFNREEMLQFFPQEVVDHLWCHGEARDYLSQGYRYLPTGDDLPIVVAARMSLSFPVLISAVPFYTVKLDARAEYRRKANQKIAHVFTPEIDFQKQWFSDGGISSNFPIHFFDSWLPSRPTFGVTLVSMPDDAKVKGPAEYVTDPTRIDLDGEVEAEQLKTEEIEKPVFIRDANRPQAPGWRPVDGIGGLLGAMWSSAQNYRDATQAMLPSYRDRIVNIRLTDDEGGLNLAMPKHTIEIMAKKGSEAGVEILKEFDFDHHRWVRFLVLMRELELQLKKLTQVYNDGKYDELIGQKLADAGYPYPRNELWRADAVKRLHAINDLVKEWEAIHQRFQETDPNWQLPDLFNKNAPHPQPVLRVTPNL
jgi:predicted acylesterase/phospholipase RssA